jgi:amino acid permease
MLGQANSYLEVASAAFGQRGTKAVQLTMFLLTFGAMTVYVCDK